MGKDKVKVISYENYLVLEGLMRVARERIAVVTHLERCFADIVDLPKKGVDFDDKYDRGGYILVDNMWDDSEPDLVALLRRAGVKVDKPKKIAKKKAKFV